MHQTHDTYTNVFIFIVIKDRLDTITRHLLILMKTISHMYGYIGSPNTMI